MDFLMNEEIKGFTQDYKNSNSKQTTDKILFERKILDGLGEEMVQERNNPDSKLLALSQKIYKELNGEDIKVVAVHAGLECGTFKQLKPDLDMISIGPDLKDVHTTKETLYLNSITKTWNLLEGILKEV